MSIPPLPDLKKASDFAKNLAGHLHTNGPLLIALTTASIAGVFVCAKLRPEWMLAFSILAIFFISYLAALCWFLSRPIRLAKRDLKDLGVEEKSILQSFLLQNKRTAHLNALFAPSASLIAKGILTYASSTFPALEAPVVIQRHAWNYLRKHPETVDLTKADIGKAKYEDDSAYLTKP
jgi:hypothetical protein